MAKAAKPAAKSTGKAIAGKVVAKKPVKKPMTKSAFLTHVAEKTELSKKQIDGVLTEIVELVKAQLSSKGAAGKIVIPGLARITLTPVKGQKGGIEKINPLNNQPYITKDKEPYNKVIIRPIKALKEALK